MGKFEGCLLVVVEPANETIVELEGDLDCFQQLLYSDESASAHLVQELRDAWELFDDRLILWNFAVEYAERIGYSAALAVAAHFGCDRSQCFAQGFIEARSVCGACGACPL